ncbi:1671_t:CDS:10 [Ambispora leptoticha]|uniref:Phosphoinositide phospholipase C n=1 Tax=Ambispora leptoticha TaxID=144679 RepID=A0A9N8YRZ5_9GLOM|nr:1671_t:CDS:10 [Ambispora leptoticha]
MLARAVVAFVTLRNKFSKKRKHKDQKGAEEVEGKDNHEKTNILPMESDSRSIPFASSSQSEIPKATNPVKIKNDDASMNKDEIEPVIDSSSKKNLAISSSPKDKHSLDQNNSSDRSIDNENENGLPNTLSIEPTSISLESKASNISIEDSVGVLNQPFHVEPAEIEPKKPKAKSDLKIVTSSNFASKSDSNIANMQKNTSSGPNAGFSLNSSPRNSIILEKQPLATPVPIELSTSNSLTYTADMSSSARRILAHQQRRKSLVNEVVVSSIVTSEPVLTGNQSKDANSTPALTLGETQATIKQVNDPQTRKLRRQSTSYPALDKTSLSDSIYIDKALAEGISLTKVSAKKQRSRTFRIDVDQGRILWDSKKSGKVNIENIKELRVGEAARYYREHFNLSSEVEPKWVTIIYVDSGKYKTLHLIAPSLETSRLWVKTLEKLYQHRKDMMGGLGHMRRRQSLWLRQYWKQADKDGNSKLAVDEVVRLCHQLNINLSKNLLKQKFDEADEGKRGELEFADFQRFVKLIKRRQELEELFESLAKTNQDINLAEEDYGYVYQKFLDNDRKAMTLEGFTSFLMSSDNPVFCSEHSKLFQDMTQPLSHYFIDSSHNTYLLGYQLKGESSIEGYIRVLQRGCRCVEIDCWDGTDGPIVTHGHTLTSKISFQDTISAIRSYAFKASPYPLILSLEIHCSLEQQTKMAQILRETLGGFLVTEALSEHEKALPSPADLLYKILIKGKNIPHDNAEEGSTTDTESATDTESEAESSKETPHHPKKKVKNKTKPRVSKELSDLVIYCSAVKFKGFEHHHEKSNFRQMSSFSERASVRLGKAERNAFIRHNIRQLSRIYPAGTRIKSSNYEPHHHWMFGNQLVALNWQKFDVGMQMNQAMFAVNGRCGYVLKPKSLRDPPPINSSESSLTHISTRHLKIEQLPRPRDQTKGDIVDPFVELELFVPGAEVQKFKTKTIPNNGFNPIWKETFTFHINCEELALAFLRFSVYDEDVRNNEFIASYCISVASLQPGYRHVQLNDGNGEQYLFTSLFIRSTFILPENNI